MDHTKSLFNNFRQCANCKRPLPEDYKDDLCPRCMEMALFSEVKSFIRENNVNEYEVAAHFDIPLRQVRAWIREGRIEYKDEGSGSIGSLHCQRCGAPVTFGSLCPKCLQLLNGKKGYQAHNSASTGNEKMRFFDKEE